MFNFIKITILTVIVCLTVITIGFFAYDKLFSVENENSIINNIFTEDPEEEGRNINALIVGIDELGIHTDTIILANFDTKENYIDLVSIPRDFKIHTSDEIASNLSNAPRDMKITELYAYSGKEHGMEYLQETVEDIFHTEIDFYIKIELEAFRYLVDEMGGVYFDVPMNMVYSDPYQDLYINIEEGYQLLDGNQAEQVIRFRKGYANADLGRIEVQQDFLKAIISQLITSDDKVNTITSLAKTGLKYTENNISLDDITSNLKYLDNISTDKIRTFTLPVENAYINGVSYVVLKEDEYYTMLDELFYISDGTEPAEETLVPSNSLTVSVLNGSEQDGKAAEIETLLENNGIPVENIGNYSDETTEYTRIFVKDRLYGTDLLDFFKNPEIIVNHDQEYDIEIVVGKED
ncbi:MAG: LCP family protein [Lachnospirales bacterium]